MPQLVCRQLLHALPRCGCGPCRNGQRLDAPPDTQAKKAAEAAAKPPSKKAALLDDSAEEADPAAYYANRVKALEAKKAKGVNPYPHKFHVSISLPHYIDKYAGLEPGERLSDVTVSIAGVCAARVWVCAGAVRRVRSRRASSCLCTHLPWHLTHGCPPVSAPSSGTHPHARTHARRPREQQARERGQAAVLRPAQRGLQAAGHGGRQVRRRRQQQAHCAVPPHRGHDTHATPRPPSPAPPPRHNTPPPPRAV
jgi:hypothetical protein